MRHYIEDRFGVRSPEQTTEEFLAEMAAKPFLDSSLRRMVKTFMIHCDLVKFAKFGPTKEEILESFDSARHLVDETKSTEEEEAA